MKSTKSKNSIIGNVRNTALHAAICNDNANDFFKLISNRKIETKDLFNCEKIYVVNNNGEKIALMNVIVINNAIKIFDSLVEDYKINVNEYTDNHLIVYAICAEKMRGGTGAEILEYLISNKDCKLFFNGINIIYHLILEIQTGLRSGNQEKDFIDLFLEKLDVILNSLQKYNRQDDIKSLFYHHENKAMFFNSFVSNDINLVKFNTDYQVEVVYKILNWLIQNKHLDFFTKPEMFQFWNLKSDKLNKLIDKAKENGIKIKMVKNLDFTDSNLLIKRSKNKKHVEEFIKNAVNIKHEEETGNEENCYYRDTSWEDVTNDYEFFLERNNIQSIVLNQKEKSYEKLHKIFEKLAKSGKSLYYHYTGNKNEQPPHITAAEKRKYDVLCVILNATHGYKFDDNVTLEELIAQSNDNFLSATYIRSLSSSAKNHINKQNELDGNTLFHHAVKYKNTELLNIILRKQPDFSLKNNEGKTAYQLASELEDKTIFNIITEAKNNPTEKSSGFIQKIDTNFEIEQPNEKVKRTNEQQTKEFTLSEQLESRGVAFERITAKWDHNKIDAYKKFKYAKSNPEPEKVEEIYTWKIGNYEYKSDDNENIFCHKFKEVDEYYLTIDKKIKLDVNLYNHFKGIIQNTGFAKTKFDSDGVKLIKNSSVAEIKSLSDNYSDIKPYALECYKNYKGKKLIIFNQVTNHEGINVKVRETTSDKLEIVELFDVIEDNNTNNVDFLGNTEN